MASKENTNDRIIFFSDNILLSIDDNNIGDMYIYDHDYQYILNGLTASDLVNYFKYTENGWEELADEILDVMMDLTVHMETQ